MRDQKVWTLSKFKRLHIGGGINIYKHYCYMFQVTHKLKQIKRLATSSVIHNRIHTSEAANQFSDCRMTNSCPILNERVCEVIPHLWLSWYLYVFGECTIHALVSLTWWEGQASPYILLNWWKGKPSGSIACTRKQQPQFYWSCSSVVMNDATPLTPLAHERNSIFNCEQHTCTLHDPWKQARHGRVFPSISTKSSSTAPA